MGAHGEDSRRTEDMGVRAEEGSRPETQQRLLSEEGVGISKATVRRAGFGQKEQDLIRHTVLTEPRMSEELGMAGAKG